jgi:high mobility group protein B2
MSSDEDTENSYESDDMVEEPEPEPAPKPVRRRGKNGKDPNRPKRNMSAFFLYSNANRARVKIENPDIKFGQVAQILSEEFKQISAEERAKWDAEAVKDKERYQREMAVYVPPDDLDDFGPKKKKKKDPNAPKRNMSAFFLYSNDVRATVKQENPEAKFGDIAKIISVQYKQLSEKDVEIYAKKAAADKERYYREMKIYKETL